VGKYDDIFGPGGEEPGPPWMEIGDPGPGGGGGGGGGGFIPTYSGGGLAQPWGGQPISPLWAQLMRRRMKPGVGGPRTAFSRGGARPMAASQMGAGAGPAQGASPMSGGFPASPGALMQWAQQQQQQTQQAPGGPFEQGALGPIGALLQQAFMGGDPNYGGAFSLNPPQAIMGGIRQQAVADAGARERAARLGLQSRGDADPSTYGFQALMSQLQGQDQTARTMGQADLGLRQQQLQNYWQLLSQLLSGQLGVDQTERQGRWNRASQPGPWGQIAQGAGTLAGSLFGG